MTTLLNPTIETINNNQTTPEGRFFNAAEIPSQNFALSLIGRLALDTELRPGERADITSTITHSGEQVVAALCASSEPRAFMLGVDAYQMKHRVVGKQVLFGLDGYDQSERKIIRFNYWAEIPSNQALRIRSAKLEDYVRLIQNVEQARALALGAEPLPQSA